MSGGFSVILPTASVILRIVPDSGAHLDLARGESRPPRSSRLRGIPSARVEALTTGHRASVMNQIDRGSTPHESFSPCVSGVADTRHMP